MSLPMWGAWIETAVHGAGDLVQLASLPTCGAWIETNWMDRISLSIAVAPHVGSVD